MRRWAWSHATGSLAFLRAFRILEGGRGRWSSWQGVTRSPSRRRCWKKGCFLLFTESWDEYWCKTSKSEVHVATLRLVCKGLAVEDEGRGQHITWEASVHIQVNMSIIQWVLEGK